MSGLDPVSSANRAPQPAVAARPARLAPVAARVDRAREAGSPGSAGPGTDWQGRQVTVAARRIKRTPTEHPTKKEES